MVTYSHNLPLDWKEEIAVGAGENLNWLLVFCDEMPRKADLRIRLAGLGSRAELSVLHLGRGSSQTAMNVEIIHEAPATFGRVTAKSALFDRARFNLRGMLKMTKEAKGGDSYLLARALLVSPQSKAELYPYLEIKTDEVRASHGASVGALDRNQLFYLRSRGLSENQAERIILGGFFRDITQSLPPAYREKFFQTSQF